MRGTAFRAGWGEIEIEVEYVNLHQHLNLGLDWAWVQLGLWTGLDRNWIEQGRAEQRRDERSRKGGWAGRKDVAIPSHLMLSRSILSCSTARSVRS